MFDWEEIESHIYSKGNKPEMELPEDILYYFSQRNSSFDVLVDVFELELIY